MKTGHILITVIAAIAVVSLASLIFFSASGPVAVESVTDNDGQLDQFSFLDSNDKETPIVKDAKVKGTARIAYTGDLTGWSDKVKVQKASGVVIFGITINEIPYEYIFRFGGIDHDSLNGYLKDGIPMIEADANKGFSIELLRYDHRQYTDVQKYEFRTFERQMGDNHQLPTYYGDSFFDKPSTERNMDLLAFALCLEMSSGFSSDERYESVIKLLRDIGCANAIPNETYHEKATMTSTDVAIGSKQYGDYTVIFLVMNGAKYSAEFATNVMLGESGDHVGFCMVRDEGLKVLKEFIKDNGITGKTKIMVTGYSRTGAGSNLVGAYISDAIAEGRIDEEFGNITLEQKDFYCFSFETPLCGYYEEGKNYISPTDPRYDNIWYVVNDDDLVTYVPPKAYGFVRYGHQITNYAHDPVKSTGMLDTVARYYTKEVAEKIDMSAFNSIGGFTYMSDFVDGFSEKFFSSLGTREYYYENVEYDFARFIYAAWTNGDLLNDIIEEYGGPIVFVSDLYLYTDEESVFINHFRPAIAAATEKYDCEEFTDNILNSFYQISELVKRYSDDDMYSMLTDEYLLSMIANSNLLLMSHMLVMNYGYVVQESDLYK